MYVMTNEFETLQVRCMNNWCCARIRSSRRYRIAHIIGAVLCTGVFVFWNIIYWTALTGSTHMKVAYIFLTPVLLTLIIHNALWGMLSVLQCWRKDVLPVVEHRRAVGLRGHWPHLILNSPGWNTHVLWRPDVTLYHNLDVITFLLVVTPEPFSLYCGAALKGQCLPPLMCPSLQTTDSCVRCQTTGAFLASLGYRWDQVGLHHHTEPGVVPSLASFARLTTRTALRPNVAYGVYRLPLPTALQSFLLYDSDLVGLANESVLKYLLPLIGRGCLKRNKETWSVINPVFSAEEHV